ncbi:GTPase [Anaeroselena agilis]|uniref:50S ribosome-binding GTPase n=1 Tax=Anaeroselena agilis TaxID=3063788 RepID=A0ABU3NX62_9FIRM|nr:50S ribosome-binding GTPase [Selenomonadales bacterium 4137-cl]
MKEFAVVGRPNSGKTLFTLNFAAYLGCKTVDITFRAPDGLLDCRHYVVNEARRELCGPMTHKTRAVQSVVLKVPVGKTAVSFKLSDTCGVSEQIHGEEGIRRGMAQTLSLVRSTDFIIHVVDVALATDAFFGGSANIDREIYNYGVSRNRYILLANKTDLPRARENLAPLTAAFHQAVVLPVSALYSTGFGEVKAYVAANV